MVYFPINHENDAIYPPEENASHYNAGGWYFFETMLTLGVIYQSVKGNKGIIHALILLNISFVHRIAYWV